VNRIIDKVDTQEPQSFGNLPIRVIEAIGQAGEVTKQALELVRLLARESEAYGLPEEWLLRTATAMESGNWEALSTAFVSQEFLGVNGSFLVIGPYTIRREGEIETRLSGLYGSVIPHPPMPPLETELHEMFGPPSQTVTQILPVALAASCGNLGSEVGEAFVTPDGWGFPSSAAGPALNDMDEQSRRFLESGQVCIRHIFDSHTADLLLKTYENDDERVQVQHQEYQFHEAGHATGLGLTRKLNEDLLSTWWHGAVEEWRADGISFEVAARLLTEEAFGRLVASNLCTRFGLDAHRSGGSDRDRDVAAVLLTLDQLLRSGALIISKKRLALRDPSYRGLVRATAFHRAYAMRLTQDELALQYEIGMHALYGSVAVESGSRAIFEGLVREPCFGIYKGLR